MKTIALFAVLVISWALPAGAQEERAFSFRFSSELLAGFMEGGGVELVYGAPSGAEFLSRLDWDMRPLYYYGAALDFTLDTPIALSPFARLTVKSGVNGNTGFMEDRDWQDDDETYLTDFSRHDNYTRGAFFIEGDLGLRIRPLGPLTLEFLFRAYWAKLIWESLDGYTQHNKQDGVPSSPSWSADQPKTYHTGAAIDYSQEWLLFAPGLGLDLSLSKFFSLGASFSLSPFIWCVTRDYHYWGGDRSVYDEYQDYPRGGLYLKPEGRLSFFPSEWVTLSLHASWTRITGSRGLSRMRKAGYAYWAEHEDGAGAGLGAWDVGLGIKVGS